MVGKRNRSFRSQRQNDHANDDKDIENGLHQRPRFSRFRDAVTLAIDNKKRADLKKQLKEGIDRDGLEQYRKSEEEVADSLHRFVGHR